MQVEMRDIETKLKALRTRYKENTDKITAALVIIKRAEQDISSSKEFRSQPPAIFHKRQKPDSRPSAEEL